MKVCPHCSFANEEQFPTCVYCNTSIVDVPSIPSADPSHPEHEQRALSERRRKDTRRQLRFAGILYALGIALIAWIPGLISSLPLLLLFFASGLVVAFAITRNIAGQFSASLLQGVLSVIILVCFGALQPFVAFMLVGHIVLPGFLWHWMDLIVSANR
jgi:hypothetical protein